MWVYIIIGLSKNLDYFSTKPIKKKRSAIALVRKLVKEDRFLEMMKYREK